MTVEQRFSPLVQCKHCSNRAPMPIKVSHSEIVSHEPPLAVARSVAPWDEGPVFELLKCPACGKINLATYYWHDAMDASDADYQIVYPVARCLPEGLPAQVQSAYSAALSVRSVDANAFGVLLGRVLEIVCVDRRAEGRSLADQLRDLAGKGEIPEKLVEVARGLRQFRNVGAHAGLGTLTEVEVPILDDLTRAILEYVYSAPLLAQKAATRLAALGDRRTE